MAINNARSNQVSMKRPLTDKQLIAHLEQRLTFNDSENLYAPIFFKNNIYYRFSIYPKLLPSRSDGLRHSFTDSINLYKFDEFLRDELSIFLDYIEQRLKSTLIHYFCNNYSNPSHYISQCYIDSNLYHPSKYRYAISCIEKCIQYSETPAMTHYKNNPNQGDTYIPIWIVLDELTFGYFNTLVDALKTSHINNWVRKYLAPINSLGHNREVIISWVNNLRLLRNAIAHHGRLYGKNFKVQPQILNRDNNLFTPGNKPSEINRIYGSMYVIKKLLVQDTNNDIKRKWNRFLEDLKQKIDSNQNILECDTRLGFPDEWHKNLHVLTHS